jgi:hypothetical protein
MAVSAFDRAREAYRAIVHGIDEKVLLFFIQFLALYVSPRPRRMDSLTSQAVALLIWWMAISSAKSAYCIRRRGQRLKPYSG